MSALWVLYVSEECELCDRAVAVLAAARAPEFECRSIESDELLTRRYGERVPVFCHVRSGRELGWPFDAPMVQSFVAECELAR